MNANVHDGLDEGMESLMRAYIATQIGEAGRVMSTMLADESLLATLENAAQACISCLKTAEVLLAGNGGSAADAQHIAGELVSRFAFDRADCLRSH